LAILGFLALIFVIWLIKALSQLREKAAPRGLRVEATLHYPKPHCLDRATEHWLDQHPEIDKFFPSKVAGVSQENRDGSSRQQILQRCSAPESLRLVPEPDNPVDLKAIAVLRQNGEQLGYLNARLAQETYNRLRKGERWGARLTAITGDDDPHHTHGANILMFRFKSGA
jgi:hypothetical protein